MNMTFDPNMISRVLSKIVALGVRNVVTFKHKDDARGGGRGVHEEVVKMAAKHGYSEIRYKTGFHSGK